MCCTWFAHDCARATWACWRRFATQLGDCKQSGIAPLNTIIISIIVEDRAPWGSCGIPIATTAIPYCGWKVYMNRMCELQKSLRVWELIYRFKEGEGGGGCLTDITYVWLSFEFIINDCTKELMFFKIYLHNGFWAYHSNLRRRGDRWCFCLQALNYYSFSLFKMWRQYVSFRLIRHFVETFLSRCFCFIYSFPTCVNRWIVSKQSFRFWFVLYVQCKIAFFFFRVQYWRCPQILPSCTCSTLSLSYIPWSVWKT